MTRPGRRLTFRPRTPEEQREARLRRLARPVAKLTQSVARYKGNKCRPVHVVVHRNGVIKLRLKGLQKAETLDAAAAYQFAMEKRIAAEKEEKRKASGRKVTIKRGIL